MIREFDTPSGYDVSTLGLSDDESLLVAGNYNRNFAILNAETGEVVQEHKFEGKGTWSRDYTAKFLPDSESVIIACGHDEIYRWDVKDGSFSTYAYHKDGVSHFLLQGGRESLFSFSSATFAENEPIMVRWNTENLDSANVVATYEDGFGTAFFSPNERRLISFSGPLRVTNFASDEEELRLTFIHGQKNGSPVRQMVASTPAQEPCHTSISSMQTATNSTPPHIELPD